MMQHLELRCQKQGVHLDVSAATGKVYLDASAGRCQSRALHLDDARCRLDAGPAAYLDADADATLYMRLKSIVQRKRLALSLTLYLTSSAYAEEKRLGIATSYH